MSERRYASLKQAAAYAAGSVETLRKMVARGDLTEYRLGRVVRVDLNELDDVMTAASAMTTNGAA